MIAVDTNVLVHAHAAESPMNAVATRRLKDLATDAGGWAIPVFCLSEFVRVMTHPRMLAVPHTESKARAAVEALLASPSLRVLMPGERFLPLFLSALEESGARGNLVFDCQIVAVCREAGVRSLLTEDRDFARFDSFPVQRLSRSSG